MPRYDEPYAEESDDADEKDPDKETAGLAELFCQGLTEDEQAKVLRVLSPGSARMFAELYVSCASRFEARQQRRRVVRSRW